MQTESFYLRLLGVVAITVTALFGCAGTVPAKGTGATPVVPQADTDDGPNTAVDRPAREAGVITVGAPPLTSPLTSIDVYVMSKCPYGVETMGSLVKVVNTFGGELALNIDYIGQHGPDGALSSMHGDDEVQGDIDQICGRLSAPTESQFWEFLTCVNDRWREIPAYDESCAIQSELDMTQFDQCRYGELGKKLLASSFDKSYDEKATGSPTIRFGNEGYTGSRTVGALVRYICDNWNGSQPSQRCQEIPAPAEVELIALTDTRCGDACDVTRTVNSLKTIFTGLKPTVLDWSQPRAREIYREAGIDALPALLFTESVTKDEEGFAHMGRWLTPMGPYYQVKVKASFDPFGEICDNGEDDNQNGKVDCNDAGCAGTLMCREEKKNNLEVFVMSQCPFGAMALLAMPEVKKAFPKKNMRFQIHFIASESGDEITSMHGAEEVAENTRWLCARQYFPRDYLNYVWCRAEDYRNPDWQQCAKGKIKASVIQKCVDSGEGKSLLKKDLQIAKDLDIGASPTWIANGRHKFNGVTARAIQETYCEYNPGLKGCKTPLSDERASKAPVGACGN